jgi:hypothetical protein
MLRQAHTRRVNGIRRPVPAAVLLLGTMTSPLAMSQPESASIRRDSTRLGASATSISRPSTSVFQNSGFLPWFRCRSLIPIRFFSATDRMYILQRNYSMMCAIPIKQR